MRHSVVQIVHHRACVLAAVGPWFESNLWPFPAPQKYETKSNYTNLLFCVVNLLMTVYLCCLIRALNLLANIIFSTFSTAWMKTISRATVLSAPQVLRC